MSSSGRARFGPRAAERLRPHLARFLEQAPVRARIPSDPVELPHRFSAKDDIEVVGLLSACLAYGRVELFKPKLESLLARMGPSPASFVRALDPKGAAELLEGFVYRFNVGTDVAVLLLGMGAILREEESLEAPFAQGWKRQGSVRGALDGLTRRLRQVPLAELRRRLGKERGLDHLLPSPLGPGAAKRLNLFLRWMVRGPDEVDFGIWKGVPTSALIIPLDTHIGRVARRLSLTRRKDLSWKTAEEITSGLRLLDPEDPVRFDFALCHHGMSGICAVRPRPESCRACALREVCTVGRRLKPPST